MKIVYAEELGEWLAWFPARPEIPTAYGATAKAAEAAANEALRAWASHNRKQ